MASRSKQIRAKWTTDIERRLIDIWANIVEEFGGKMITRKKKEAIATTPLNVYLYEELGRTDLYSEKAVCNKIDTVMKKEKDSPLVTFWYKALCRKVYESPTEPGQPAFTYVKIPFASTHPNTIMALKCL